MVKLWERIKMVRSRCIYFKVTVQTGHYHPDVTRALAALTQTRATLWGTNR